MTLNDFSDITETLGAGVYLLLHQGKVVFVGRSTKVLLTKIAGHRSGDRPAWFPLANIRFDQVLVKFIHPDQLQSVYFSLIAQYQPHYNMHGPTAVPASTFDRRL